MKTRMTHRRRMKGRATATELRELHLRKAILLPPREIFGKQHPFNTKRAGTARQCLDLQVVSDAVFELQVHLGSATG